MAPFLVQWPRGVGLCVGTRLASKGGGGQSSAWAASNRVLGVWETPVREWEYWLEKSDIELVSGDRVLELAWES